MPKMLKSIMDLVEDTNLANIIDLSRTPDVPQVPMERYEPKRGRPENLDEFLTKKNAERLERIAREGESAGRQWYNLEPLRMAFVEKMGEKEGTEAFNRFVDYTAATSPRSTVASNIRRGSHFYGLDRRGEQVTGLTNADMPKGYGHIAHNTHSGMIEDVYNNGSLGALSRPKVSSFSENLKGNQAPMTIDTHNFSAVRNDPKVKTSPSKTQYKYLEQYQSEIAEKLGMTPAQFQASVWIAGDTGVADSRPFIEVFDDVLTRTAQKNKTTRKKALEDFIEGKAPLFGLGALMAGGSLITPQEAEAGVLTPGVRGAREAVNFQRGGKSKSQIKMKGNKTPEVMTAQIRNQLKNPKGRSPNGIIQDIIHGETTYNDWGERMRVADGERSGPKYKAQLDAFVEDLIEVAPDLKDELEQYGVRRLFRSPEEAAAMVKKHKQGGKITTDMLMTIAAGMGAGSAGMATQLESAKAVRDTGTIRAPNSGFLHDITTGARDIERRLDGSPAGLFFPTGVVDYLEQANREERPNNATRAWAFLDFI